MSNCLVTRLKDTVSDPDYELRTFEALRVSYPSDATPTEINLQSNTGGKIVVLKGGKVNDQTEVDYGTEWKHYSITESNGLIVDITNKYDLVKCEAKQSVIYSEELKYSEDLEALYAGKIIGKLSDTPNVTVIFTSDGSEYVVDMDIPEDIVTAALTGVKYISKEVAESIYKCTQCVTFRCQQTYLTKNYGITAETIVEGMCENGRESGTLTINAQNGVTINGSNKGTPITCTFTSTGCTVTNSSIGTKTYNKTTHTWS